jgi:hypothetical protein
MHSLRLPTQHRYACGGTKNHQGGLRDATNECAGPTAAGAARSIACKIDETADEIHTTHDGGSDGKLQALASTFRHSPVWTSTVIFGLIDRAQAAVPPKAHKHRPQDVTETL